MITYITKDITTVTMGVIAHGVNCQGAMGSGVARALYEKWPIVKAQYLTKPTGKAMLGICDLVRVSDNDQLFVCNCYTQLFYGKNGRFADPKSIDNSLWKAYEYADYYHLPLYMPKIGAGLGGLDWEKEVEPIVIHADTIWSRVNTYVCVWGAS